MNAFHKYSLLHFLVAPPITGKQAWRRCFRKCAAIFAALTLAQAALGQTGPGACGPLQNGYGPFDARIDKAKLPVVLDVHFTPVVVALVGGSTASQPGPDIDYTLRAIPNYPRALAAMMQLGEKQKSDKPSGSRYTVECWFDRALRFRPDDHVVRMLYVNFLTKKTRKPDALQHLESVLNTAKDNPFTLYNVGLLYFDLGEHEKALIQAHKAIALGLTRPELTEKLKAAGKWQEPTSSANTLAGSSAAASAPQKP